jgi:hypothetical protein
VSAVAGGVVTTATTCTSGHVATASLGALSKKRSIPFCSSDSTKKKTRQDSLCTAKENAVSFIKYQDTMMYSRRSSVISPVELTCTKDTLEHSVRWYSIVSYRITNKYVLEMVPRCDTSPTSRDRVSYPGRYGLE